jgi:hypothetical protein
MGTEGSGGWWPTSPSSRLVGRSITPVSWPPTTKRICPATVSPQAGGTAPALPLWACRAKHRQRGSSGCSRAAIPIAASSWAAPTAATLCRVRRRAALDQERVNPLWPGRFGDGPGGAGRSSRWCPGGGRLLGRTPLGVRPINREPVDGPPSSAHDERNNGRRTISRPCGPGAHSRALEKTSLRLRRHSHISFTRFEVQERDRVPPEPVGAAAAHVDGVAR